MLYNVISNLIWCIVNVCRRWVCCVRSCLGGLAAVGISNCHIYLYIWQYIYVWCMSNRHIYIYIYIYVCMYVCMHDVRTCLYVAGGSGGSGRICSCCQTVLFSPLCAGHDVTLDEANSLSSLRPHTLVAGSLRPHTLVARAWCDSTRSLFTEELKAAKASSL